MSGIHGIYVLDKPHGLTSFQATRQVARLCETRRAGHGGTLDPLATGVLPICLGEATKLAAFLLGGGKEYEAEIAFGVETDTLDAQGRIVRLSSAFEVTEDQVRAVLPGFRGRLEQRPPMVAAVRHGGRRLYEWARAGIEVERAPRSIEISAIDLLGFWQAQIEIEGQMRVLPVAKIRVACSKGTYIRVLASDIGHRLGPGAHVRALRRTRSGPFTLAQAVPLDRIQNTEPLPLGAALPDWPILRVDAEVARRVAQGQRISSAKAGLKGLEAQRRCCIVGPQGDLIALGELDQAEILRPLRVFQYVSHHAD